MVTEVLGAAGIGENAFNGGLVRGFAYRERHSAKQLRSARERAFETLVSAGHSIGTEPLFNYDDVYTLAAVQLPTANAVVTEGDGARCGLRRSAPRCAKSWGCRDAARAVATAVGETA